MLDILVNATEQGEQTVPNALFGCWRRNWIQVGPDGEHDRQVQVIWLQTASGMGDMRIDPDQQPHESDSSCGITVVDETTSPYMTADWHDGPYGFAQQAVSNYPEKGWLSWQTSTVMRELAPSGAYTEEWERLPGSTSHVAHLVALDARTTTNLYLAGNHALLGTKSASAGGLHEFSWAQWSADDEHYEVALSTNHDRVGTPLELGHRWRIESYRRT